MAVIKAVSSKVSIGQALDYVMKQEKTESKLITGLGCEAETVKEEMQATKELWGKLDGRTYKHFVHSYHKSEQITPEQAHRNAIELAKATKSWDGYEVLIATHTDRGHIHSHIIVNSVSYEDGHNYERVCAELKEAQAKLSEVREETHNARNAGRKPKFTNEQMEQVRKMAADGLSVRKIAAEMSCSIGLVCKILHSNKN